MSYDGGLIVKIKNKKLGKILDEFAERGYFPEESVQGWREQPEEDDWGNIIKPKVKYTLFYSYTDCAYVHGCPKDIREGGKYIVELIREYEDSVGYGSEIRSRIEQSDVVNDYELVSWKYFKPGSGELEEFSYKKGKK